MQREQLSIPKMILYILFALVFYALQSSLFGAWSIREIPRLTNKARE